jgi:hypothetical protein
MAGKTYLIGEDGTLQALTEQGYASEDYLQALLADYPDLLAGEQIDDAAPRRWLLISRELGVPSEEDSADRWSLGHLFLDQDGIPTLAEVKRSSDTRIRREVVGQMLDYYVEIYFQWYQYKPPFESEESRRELLNRLNAIPSVALPDDSIARRPSIPLKVFEDPAALDQFLLVFEWFLNQITAT